MYLVKNPAAYQAAQKELDAVIGRGPVTVEHMSKLPYITACLRETLRLQPTAPAFSTKPLANTTDWPVYLGKDKYEIMPGQVLLAVLPAIHRDPAVYGDDAEASVRNECSMSISTSCRRTPGRYAATLIPSLDLN